MCPVESFLLSQKSLKCGRTVSGLFLDEGQQLVIFSNGFLNLSAIILMGDMVFV